MVKTILLTNRYAEAPFSIIRDALPEGFALKMLDQADAASLAKAIPIADYLLASGRLKIDGTVLQHDSGGHIGTCAVDLERAAFHHKRRRGASSGVAEGAVARLDENALLPGHVVDVLVYTHRIAVRVDYEPCIADSYGTQP